MKEDPKRFNAFKPVPLSVWEAAARLELDGANPWEKLKYSGNDWSSLPFYDATAETSSMKDAVAAPLLPASENNFLGARAWHHCPRIPVEDAKKMNEKALKCLQQGADGVFFELPDEVDFEILLLNIDWRYCALNFLAKKNQEPIADALHHFISEKKIAYGLIHGAFFGNIAPRRRIDSPFRFTGFQMKASDSPVEEIVSGFKALTDSLRNDFSSHAAQVAFHVSVGPDFFLELAKLRAIRIVWRRYAEAMQSKSIVPLFIHATSEAWQRKKYEPHENMLKSTTASMASILGGCDTLSVEPQDPSNPMMARVARNVSNILREESYFSKVADPVAGSYFVEDLTRRLSDAAWTSIHSLLSK